MKGLILLLAFSTQAHAYFQSANGFPNPLSANVASSSSSTIPTSFGTGALNSAAQSYIFTGLYKAPFKTVQVINNTSSSISWVTNQDLVAPSSTTNQRMYCIANGTATFENVLIQDKFFIQSEGATITTGNIQINLW